jgi:hypothetical protein
MTHLVDLVTCEGGIGGHEEVAAWGRNEGGDYSDEIVVHVAGIAQGLGARCHDSGYLREQKETRSIFQATSYLHNHSPIDLSDQSSVSVYVAYLPICAREPHCRARRPSRRGS